MAGNTLNSFTSYNYLLWKENTKKKMMISTTAFYERNEFFSSLEGFAVISVI